MEWRFNAGKLSLLCAAAAVFGASCWQFILRLQSGGSTHAAVLSAIFVLLVINTLIYKNKFINESEIENNEKPNNGMNSDK